MGFGCCIGEQTKESLIDGIITVAALANREGFDLGSLILSPKAIEILRTSDRVFINANGWVINTPYGLVELICDDP